MRQKTTNVLLVLVNILLAGTLWAGHRYLRSEPVTGQPVVNDVVTGLMWQGCSADQSGASCATGSDSKYPWREALAYCEHLEWGGYSDWRLPNISELLSITDRRRHDPAIDGSAFPATSALVFWSSTTGAWDVSRAWGVNFYDGAANVKLAKTDDAYVRCVRLGS